VELQRVSVARPGPAGARAARLDAVDLAVGAGEQLAIVGPSGAGKTTLLQVLACAQRPDGGCLRYDGRDPWSEGAAARARRRRALFLAPQVPPLPPRQRVVTAVLAGRLAAMGLWGSLRSLVYPADAGLAHAALELLGMGDHLYDRVDRLSGGERQRVSLARGLVSPATLWLLDEPLSALDPVRSAQALSAMRAQASRRGVTLVVAMHQVELALEHFPRLVGLREGRVAFDQAGASVAPAQWASLYEPVATGRAAAPAPERAPVGTASTAALPLGPAGSSHWR
jgi:phosphonate transport system ATP-binding protein